MPAVKAESFIRPTTGEILQKFEDPKREEAVRQANDEAIKRMKLASPVLVGVGKASDHVPGMRENLLLHAGPPLTWDRCSNAMKGAVIGGLLFEGLAKDKDEAVAMMEKGEIDFESCHDHDAAGPMAGIISSSMSVYIIEDQMSGKRYYSNLSDDLGDYEGSSIRFGVYDKAAIDHLHWVEDNVAPLLNQAIETAGYIDFISIVCKSILMGEDCHTKMDSATLYFLAELLPGLIRACNSEDVLEKMTTMIYRDQLFALNPIMATCKTITMAGSNVPHSSIVTVMARNGTDFGIKVSGLGDRWFTGLAEIGRGFVIPGLYPADVGRDMGDSAITETNGLGGVARSSAGSLQDATNNTLQMYRIAHAESDTFLLPQLDNRGAPMGFDILKVIEKKIRPSINSGMAQRRMNRPAAGAGHLHAPMEAFVNASIAFNDLEL